MPVIDLVTGFLGSGKTTFIRQYAGYLSRTGRKVCVLENDYGAINVDRVLLQDLEAQGIDVDMVIGGDDRDCLENRTRAKLIQLAMLGYDRVVMEPSGVYDVDSFFDMLCESPFDTMYEHGAVLAVVDARIDRNLSEEAQYVLVSETANAGKLILSHMDEAPERDADTEIDDVLALLNRAEETFRGSRRFTREDCICGDLRKMTDADFKILSEAGSVSADHVKLPFDDLDRDFRSFFYMNVRITKDALLTKIRALFADEAAGHVLRIKGFVPAENAWIEVNATRDAVSVETVPKGQEVIIVIGEHLDKDVVDGYFSGAVTVGTVARHC